MSIAANKNFLKDAEAKFGKYLTVEQTNRMMGILADQLVDYQIEEKYSEEVLNKDNLLDTFFNRKTN